MDRIKESEGGEERIRYGWTGLKRVKRVDKI